MILAFVLPTFMLVFFGYAISFDIDDIGLAVLDNDGTKESRELAEAFSASGYFTVDERLESAGQIDDRGGGQHGNFHAVTDGCRAANKQHNYPQADRPK